MRRSPFAPFRAVTLFLALLLVASLAPAPAAGSTDRPTDRQIRDADRYSQFGTQALKSGNLHRARTLFEKALKVIPSFPDAHMGMGHVAMGERRFEDALREYSLAREEFVEFSDGLFDLRLLHYQQTQEEIGKIHDEIMNLQKLAYTKPIGSANLIERKILELEEEIHQLEMIKPPEVDAARQPPGEVHFYIGNALFNLNRPDEALTSWETCARMSPRFSLVYNNLAVAYWKRGRVDLAIDSLERAERLGLAVNPRFKADLQSTRAETVGSATLGGSR